MGIILIFNIIYIYFKKSSRIKRKICKEEKNFFLTLKKTKVLIDSVDFEITAEIDQLQLLLSIFEIETLKKMTVSEEKRNYTLVYEEDFSNFKIEVSETTYLNIESLKKEVFSKYNLFKNKLKRDFGPKFEKFIDGNKMFKKKKRP